MSILRSWGEDLGALIFPPHCPVCHEKLPVGVRTICTRCRLEAPLTSFWLAYDNPMSRSFWGQIPIEQASALLFFSEKSGWRDLIHRFKYRGGWRLAREMGRWYGQLLLDAERYREVDLIVPVPLHWRKRLQRGYNQSEYLAEGMAQAMGIPVDRRSVIRRRNNPSQALRSHEERWKNVQDLFSVRYPERLRGKHLLLVDDVLTTGATIVSCAEAILKELPDCRISIATLAVSRHITPLR